MNYYFISHWIILLVLALTWLFLRRSAQSSVSSLSFFVFIAVVFAFHYLDQLSIKYLVLAIGVCYLCLSFRKSVQLSIVFLIATFIYFKSQIPLGELNYGLSYILFFSLSFLVHIARQEKEARPEFSSLAAFLFYPPHLLAGPFLTFDQVHSIDYKKLATSDFLKQKGMWLVTWGLLVGLSMLYIEDLTQGYLNALGEGKAEVLHLHMLKNLFYLYAHFSAWSNVAIGVSCLLGLQFPLNFDLPLLAIQPSDFWRRWHTSLGHFFSQYVYFPVLIKLGSYKFLATRARTKVFLSLFLTWLCIGLWHGLESRYIIWSTAVAFSIFIFSTLPRATYKLDIFFRWVIHFYFLLIITSIFMSGENFFKKFMVKDNRGYSQDLFWQTSVIIVLVGILPTLGDWALKRMNYEMANATLRICLFVASWFVIFFLFTHQGSPIYGQF